MNESNSPQLDLACLNQFYVSVLTSHHKAQFNTTINLLHACVHLQLETPTQLWTYLS